MLLTGVQTFTGGAHPPATTQQTPAQIATQTPSQTSAQISGVDTSVATEDRNVVSGSLVAGGKLQIVDPDPGQDHFTEVTGPAGAGAYGHFEIHADGQWTYHADNSQAAIQGLKPGDTLTDRFTVNSADGTSHQLRVVITGTNDAPVLKAATASATEDGKSVTGQMVATDVDHGDTKTFSAGQAVDGFTMNQDGSWSFDPSHAAYQHLAAGQTQQVTIPVTVTDQAGATDTQNLVITVTGSNDGPVVSGPVDLGRGTEDHSVQISVAQLLAHATDIDTGDTLSVTGLSADHGTISGDATHGFTFTPDPDYNGPVTLSYQVTDGHGGTVAQTASLTLGATDDAAIITGTDTGDLTEDKNVGRSSVHELGVSGILTVHDPDGTAFDHFQSNSLGEHAVSDPFGGSLHILRSGWWGYEVDNTHPAIQALAAGEEGHAIYEVHSADGTAHRIQITIHGTNDVPVLKAATASATEDGKSVTGQMVATDVDHGDTKTFSAGQAVDGFTMNQDGSWSFDPSHAAYQHLAAGQTQLLTIPVTVTDHAGATDTQNLVITVTGSNDGPVVSSPVDLGRGTEDHSLQISAAQLLAHATDIDTGDTLSVTGLSADHGTITGDAAHGFTFTPDPDYNGPVTLSYQVTDGHGGSVAQTASLTLGATDDAAIITGTDTGDLTEDKNVGRSSVHELGVSGILTVHDPDGTAFDHFQSNSLGEHAVSDPFGGSLHILRSGWWGYEVDNTHPAIQALAAGEEGHAIYEVHSADGTAHRINITIHGTNDGPVLRAATASATEDGKSVTGQMVATDVDHGDTKTFSAGQAVDGFTMNQDGSWSFDPSHAAYQHLATGQTQQITIPVTVTDQAGATDTQNLVITVTGTNDGPVVSGQVDLGRGTEDHSVQISAAQLLAHATDIDTGDTLSVTGLSADHGTITGDAAHGFTFTPDPDYNGPVTLSYQVTDGHGGTVAQTASLTLGATPDAAVIAGTDTGALTEDRAAFHGQLLTQGTLTVTDPDAGEAAFTPVGWQTGAATYGTFSIDAKGHWNYFADNAQAAVQGLKPGDTLTDRFEVTSVDGTKHTLSVTIAGTNDAPVLKAATASATEDGKSVTGQMVVTDVDHGDTKTFAAGQPVDGFTLNQDGSWSFDPSHAAYQHLAAGQTQQLTIPVTVTDHAGATDTQNLVITVTGSNDGPVVSGPVDLGRGTEDHSVQISAAQLLAHATDIDTGDTLSVTGLSADHGTITGDAAHGFTFTPDPDYNGPVTLSYQVTDGHGGSTAQTASLTLAATDDAAIITGTDTGDLTEDKNVGRSSVHELGVSGILTVHDPDGTAFDHFQSNSLGEHAVSDPFGGSLHILRSGWWGYEVDNTHPAIQALAAGEEGHAIYEVHSADGTAHRIDITVHGTNDAPVLSAATASATEDGKSVTGQMVVTDVDHGDTKTFAAGQAVDGFTMNQDGSWSFDPSHAAYQHLAAGQTQQITIPVTVTDHAGATDTQNLVITVTGSNDGPVVSSPVDLGRGTEDKAVLISAAQLLAHATDIDTGDVLSVSNLTASHGTITGDVAHGFTFIPDANYNGPVSLSYQVTDGHGGSVPQTASLVLGATPDAAVITGTDTGLVTEDKHVTGGLLTVDGTLMIVDPDAGESAFAPVTGVAGAGTYGTFTLDAQGHWTYTADNSQAAVQALQVGGTPLTDTLTVASLDGTTHDITVTITGTNDAPVLMAATASATEDGSSVTGQMVATDIDAGDTKAFSIGQPIDGFTMNTDGSWNFDPSHAAYQHLAAGQTQQVTIPVAVTDSAGATDAQSLVITVTGTNDGPVLTAATASAVEDGKVVTGQMIATDVDTGDTKSFSISHPVDGFAMNTDGSWTFDPSHAAYQHLAQGQVEQLTIPVTVTDRAGATGTENLVITVTGTYDAPAVTPSVAAVQGVGSQHLSGTFSSGGQGGWGIDNGHGGVVVSLQGLYGTLVIDQQTGHFEYHYQQNSGVIKQGGTSAASGQHIDTFHIVQQGASAGTADVQVQIDVQSVHGSSGHHVDHTVLQGITFSPVPTVQHDAPDEPDIDDITIDLMSADPAPPPDHDTSSQDVADATTGLGHVESQTGDTNPDAPQQPPIEPADAGAGRLASYFEAIGQDPEAPQAPPVHADQLGAYLDAVGVDPASATTLSDLPDPATLPGDDVSDLDDDGQHGASTAAPDDVSVADLPDPLLPNPNDDTNQHG
ncbi:VCBS domain-containing protein [Roseibium sp. RP-7]